MSLSMELRKLRGRQVRRVLLHAFPDGHGGNAYAPEIIFDDGSRLRFVVQETADGDDYGVRPLFCAPLPRSGG